MTARPDPLTLTAEQILAIPAARVGLLLSGDHNETFRRLAKRWHPDVGGRGDVFEHILALRKEAEKRVVLLEDRRGGGKFRLMVRKRHPFELGEVLLGQTMVAYHIRKEYEDLALHGVRAYNSLTYPSPQMKDDLSRFFPKERAVKETTEGTLIVLEKTSDVVMLQDLIEHMGGAIPPKHVMWLISSLLNLLCFLSISERTHNGLTTESVFVSPKFHAVSILGGWWYSARGGGPLKFLPPAVHAVAPTKVLLSKTSDYSIDLEAVRAIGRACVGGSTAVSMLPRPFANFLRLPAPSSPIQDYTDWEKVREDSYGPRRYLKLEIDGADVYP